MKKQTFLCFVSFIAVLVWGATRISAQETNPKSNGIIEILSIHLPDSVVFKPAAAGNELRNVHVYFASGQKRELMEMRITHISFTEDLMPYYTDQSVFTARGPSKFMPRQILFVVGGRTVYSYDLEQDRWEPGSIPIEELKGNTGRNRRRNP